MKRRTSSQTKFGKTGSLGEKKLVYGFGCLVYGFGRLVYGFGCLDARLCALGRGGGLCPAAGGPAGARAFPSRSRRLSTWARWAGELHSA